MTGLTSSRKLDHLHLCAETDVAFGNSGFSDVRLVHNAVPECSASDIDIRTEFLGRKLSAPIFIAAMTGGHPDTAEVNKTLAAAAERFGIPISQQVFDAAIGMHGAGFFRAQCGLVEGALMFIGICATERGMKKKDMMKIAYGFCEAFTARFHSLLCRDLRPGGFQKTDPPHACEPFTADTMDFTIKFIQQYA